MVVSEFVDRPLRAAGGRDGTPRLALTGRRAGPITRTDLRDSGRGRPAATGEE